MALTQLGSAAEVLVATGHDPFARGTLRRPSVRGWLSGRAVAWMTAEEGRSYLSALGPPAEVGALVGALVEEIPPRQRITVPRGTPVHLPAWMSMGQTDWDFRWLAAPPPVQPGEEAVDDVDADEVGPLLTESSPTASALPGDPAVRRWVGIRDGGRLIACAADTSAATGIGHLSSIAVHPSARGRGLGRTVTAALTRRLFDDGRDLVTLGMYADNAYGRATYDALGFTDDHRFTSGPLEVRGRW
ncbi:MAG: GNAT family N-acetyltransferase [Actinobacteria bacterium]|nr:GNAT family N-acetyltransferase [Actinomycetota bacterium]MCA1719913.1 GNAT family N-acetyltransferase [Actinomycetota bacterium]